MENQTDLFFIAILPPRDLQQEVTSFKEYASTHFNSKHALRSPPHITLISPFRWPVADRNSLNQFLDSFRFLSSPFDLKLQDFDCFAPRVIFVDVKTEPLLVEMQEQLKTEIERALGVEHKGPFGFHPHMTIAFRDLEQSVFPQAWAYFSEQSYLRTFTVENLTLLRHQVDGWQVEGSFSLQN